jgi:hypothetical protein
MKIIKCPLRSQFRVSRVRHGRNGLHLGEIVELNFLSEPPFGDCQGPHFSCVGVLHNQLVLLLVREEARLPQHGNVNSDGK